MIRKSNADRQVGDKRGTGPQPTTVPYNDWKRVDLPPLGAFTPAMGVSVVIPYFDEQVALGRTLAALERQTYPRDLFEVIVVDDGSPEPLLSPAHTPLDLTVVHQEDRGFGLSRARNNGVRGAKHGIIVFLDADMLAESEFLTAHARWHHQVSDVVTQGLFSRVCVDGLQAEAIRTRSGSIRELLAHPFQPPWMEGLMGRTNDLTSRSDALFRVASGGNLGIGRAFFDAVGGFDESFVKYGVEDTEFVYRAQTRGALLVPVRDAFAWHQGERDELDREKGNALGSQQAKARDLIAHRDFRATSPGRSFTVPRYVVTVRVAEEPVEQVAGCVEHILGDTEFDLVVRVEIPVSRPDDAAWLRDWLGGDSRVRIGPLQTALDDFPASPYHVNLPPVANLPHGFVARLSAKLGAAVVLRVMLRDGSVIVLERAWSLHRARRTGKRPEDFGDVVKDNAIFPFVKLRHPTSVFGALPMAWLRSDLRRRLALLFARARRVRGPRTAWVFLKWLGQAVRSRVQRLANSRSCAGSAQSLADDALLGVEIAAVGDRARAVFGRCREVRHGVGDDHVDLVLADSAGDASDVGDVPVVDLSESPGFAVPAFDPRLHNPIGWPRDVGRRIAALGSESMLPQAVKVHLCAGVADVGLLRQCHHVVDVGAFHSDVVQRAGALVRLAASGVPVYLVDRSCELETLLGRELYGLMTTEIGRAVSRRRELLSIGMRRAALRNHSLQSRARQVCEAVLADPPRTPGVSVLLATRRPDFLPWAIANVVRQNYPRLELVLALHGDHFRNAEVARVLSQVKIPVEILQVPAEKPLGTVLNLASAAASGTLLTKMDDDDLYGVDHIWDLVLAQGYSGAQLVGKRAEVVYIKARYQTVLLSAGASEAYGLRPNGSALLVSREDLETLGGWRRTPRSEDTALLNSVARAGGAIYGTHSAGYVVVRHGIDHSWGITEKELLGGTYATYAGWRPDFAGMDGLPSPPWLTDRDDAHDR